MIDFRKIIGYYDPELPALDPTTSWCEFNYYLECCKSLEQKPSVGRFVAYNNYFRDYGK